MTEVILGMLTFMHRIDAASLGEAMLLNAIDVCLRNSSEEEKYAGHTTRFM